MAAALSCAMTSMATEDAVGLGAGSDAAIVARKVEVVSAALSRMAQAGRLGEDADRSICSPGSVVPSSRC